MCVADVVANLFTLAAYVTDSCHLDSYFNFLVIRASEGIISNRGVTIPVDSGETLYDLIETSAAINPGNSGGPLVNLAGEVIGITSIKVAAQGVEGMGYAISSETALPVIQQLIQKGFVTRPWLGVSLYDVDQLAIQRYNLSVKAGAVITEVAPKSPAEAAGLQVGDVITRVNGTEITNSEDVLRAIHGSQVGKELTITYYRGTTQATTKATLIESPNP